MIGGIDLHYDLLSYLAKSPSHTPNDPFSAVNLSHVEKGGIGTLVLPIYSPTREGSQLQLEHQTNIFHTLLSPVKLIPAIENASCFLGEEELLEEGFKRLERVCAGSKMKFLYVSLTWNGENRLGGGIGVEKGLTAEGKEVLDRIPSFVFAVDLSHASDLLAGDILRYLDETKSPLKVLASHANFRAVQNVPRNLPDEIVKEIVRRNGVIGLTLIRSFVGPTISSFYDHVAYALKNRWENHIAFGPDFFDLNFEQGSDLDRAPKELQGLDPVELHEKFIEDHFFPECRNDSFLQDIAKGIAHRFGSDMGERIWEKNAQEKLISFFDSPRL